MATQAKMPLSQDTTSTPPLFLAFESGVRTWCLGFTTGAAPRPTPQLLLFEVVPTGGVGSIPHQRTGSRVIVTFGAT
jgi:hypothetical protein